MIDKIGPTIGGNSAFSASSFHLEKKGGTVELFIDSNGIYIFLCVSSPDSSFHLHRVAHTHTLKETLCAVLLIHRSAAVEN